MGGIIVVDLLRRKKCGFAENHGYLSGVTVSQKIVNIHLILSYPQTFRSFTIIRSLIRSLIIV